MHRPQSLLAIFALLFLGSCSSEPTSPADVLSEFFARLERGNFAEAAALAQDGTGSFLELIQDMVDASNVTGEFLTLPKGGQILDGEAVELGPDSVEFRVKRGEHVETIMLVRERGLWRVKLPESLF